MLVRARVHLAVAVFVIVAAVTAYLAGQEARPSDVDNDNASPCQRVVSLAPSITETLFALGLGDRVVGVTRYCDFPAEARTKEKIGGYSTPNYELIFDLRPDVVFLLNLHQDAKKHLTALNIETQTVVAERVDDVFGSIEAVGRVCSEEQRARDLVRSIEERLARIQQKTANLKRPRVLVSVGRSMGSNSIKDVFVAGRNSFFSQVVELAGGANAMEQGSVIYPRLSAEGILDLNPAVIVDLVVNNEEKNISEEEVILQWKSVGRTDAFRNGRVHVLGQDYVVVPGPRFIELVEQLARLFHPDLDWS